MCSWPDLNQLNPSFLAAAPQDGINYQINSGWETNESSQSGDSAVPHSTRAILLWLRRNYCVTEGVSIPRLVLYNHYAEFFSLRSCDLINASSFGKLVKKEFPSVTTRRLGSRNRSKYHYFGLGMQETALNFEPRYSILGIGRKRQRNRLSVDGSRRFMVKDASPRKRTRVTDEYYQQHSVLETFMEERSQLAGTISLTEFANAQFQQGSLSLDVSNQWNTGEFAGNHPESCKRTWPDLKIGVKPMMREIKSEAEAPSSSILRWKDEAEYDYCGKWISTENNRPQDRRFFADPVRSDSIFRGGSCGSVKKIQCCAQSNST
ncbi:uncharacterized protein [Bemisia tabaci]|uniref:uncharacterized protein n=1 Tax=Bemisia tabaci TaxID=7038 RepID=UPI003B27BDB8